MLPWSRVSIIRWGFFLNMYHMTYHLSILTFSFAKTLINSCWYDVRLGAQFHERFVHISVTPMIFIISLQNFAHATAVVPCATFYRDDITLIWMRTEKKFPSNLNYYPDSNVYGANMGPTWVLSVPDGPHVGPMNLTIWVVILVSVRHPIKKRTCEISQHI